MSQAHFQANNPYAQFGSLAIDAPADARLAFIRRTYIHLAAAIYAFVAIEYLLFKLDFDRWFINALGNTPFSWLLVLGLFMGVGWIAQAWANSDTSVGKQYAGLFLYTLAEAVIFVPLLALAKDQVMTIKGIGQVPIIPAAAATTLIMFGGLTAIVFVTRKDFSFLAGFLGLGMFGALALIVISILFPVSLGIVWFSGFVVILACGYVLYYTSNILHHYRTTQHVAAALALFASIALLFYYILMLFLSNRD